MSIGLTQDLEKAMQDRTRVAVHDAVKFLFSKKVIEADPSTWAAKYRRLTGGKKKRWDPSLTPYLDGISKSLADPDTRIIVVSKASQMGGSELALSWILWHLHQMPAPIVFYTESKEKAKKFRLERLDPALAVEPFIGQRIRHFDETRITPGGGMIVTTSANPSSLSSTTAKLVIGDEASQYKPNIGGRGDFLSLAKGRVVTFGDDSKILIVSTPTDAYEGEGTFPTYIESGDMREYQCACPECGEYYTWGLDNFQRLEDGECVMACPECGGMTFDGDQRTQCVQEGRWQATKEPQEGVVSYLLSGFVAPSKTGGRGGRYTRVGMMR